MKAIIYVLLGHCFLLTCLAELSEEKKVQFVTSFVDYLNNLPNHAFIYDDGVLLNAQKTDENNYKIEIKLKVTSIHNLEAYSYHTCSVSLEDTGGSDIHIKDDYNCEPPPPSTTTEFNVDSIVSQEKSTTTEDGIEHLPVQLDNEVQTNTAATSGEQFIAIPREKPAAPCIGCSTFVNPGAAGVEELALLGIRHLNRHDPDVKHELNSVVEVERQVQIVNGVRYILTLKVDYNNCTIDVAESCTVVKPCKISILEKPWVRLYDGSKYRGILANNCTEEWIFSDNGEVINDENKGKDIVKVPKDDLDNEGGAHKPIPDFDKIANTGSVDDILKAIHNSDVQAQPLTERTLSEGEVKKLEEQVIPYNQFSDISTLHEDEITAKPDSENFNSHSINKIESRKKYIPNSNSFTFDSEEKKINSLNSDKKKAIDDLLNFFASVDSHSNQQTERRKRNLNFVGGKLQKNINDPMYKTLAEESLAKYLQISNEDEEYEVLKVEDVSVQVVSGQLTTITFQIVKKNAHSSSPQKCTAHVWEKPWIQFKDIKVTCQYNQLNDTRRRRQIPGGALEQNPNDPKYLELANESMQKYLQTTGNSRPHKVVEVEKVKTQVVSGTLTEIHFKIMPVQSTGDVISCLSKVWEQSWLNKKDIDVKCQIGDGKWRSKRQAFGGQTERNPNDPKYLELANESMQKYLQTTGNSQPHKVVEVEKVTTQLVSGTLTEIHFKIMPVQSTGDVISCLSKVWEQSWLNKKDIDVKCQIGDGKWRSKRQAFGGQTERNPNDPKYLELANESMQKYLQTTGNSQPHKVVEVEKVTTQLVSGTLTEIHFKIMPVQSTGDVISCLSKVWEQSWLNKKDIDVKCQIGDGKWRSKRQVIAGGITEKNPNDPKYLELANESMQKYLQTTGNSRPHKVVEVERVTTQVVAGFMTRIYFKILPMQGTGDVISCLSKVWERSRQEKDIDVKCQIGDGKWRSKRQAFGGQTERNPNHPKYLELANESMQKYLQTTGNSQPHKVVEVEKVTTQLVSGTLTEIHFKIMPVQSTGDVISCLSKVWEQSWLNKKDIDVKCQIGDGKWRSKRQAFGGQTERNPNDPKYLELANESMQKYLQTTGNSQPHKVVEVEKVTTQLVSGTLTEIHFKIMPVQSTGDVISCLSKVWEQSWLNKKDIDVKCQIGDGKWRSKRQAFGGQTERNPNDPKYLELANESMQKYLQTTGNSQPHKVVEVEKVTTQLVSGTLTEIHFKIMPVQSTGDVISCLSKVWEQSWLNKKDIDVKCQIGDGKWRSKRQVIAGGITEKNPNDPKYLELANESMQKYLQTTGNSRPHKVVEVERVTTQVVAGFMTRIYFKILPMQGTGDVISCLSKVWERSRQEKDIDVKCQIGDGKWRSKRQAFGGQTERNPNDPKYLELANESMQKYLQTTGNSQPHKVVEVEKVTTQLVSGTLTEIHFKIMPVQSTGDVISCLSKVWEQSWLNKKDIDVKCQIGDGKWRSKRQVIAGGITEKNPNDPKYLELANESMQKYLQTTGNSRPHKVVEVERVTTQVVAGFMTRIYFKILPMQGTGDVISCLSKVWERSRQEKDIDVKCQIGDGKWRSKRQAFGGQTERNPNDPKYLELANESMQKYLQTTGNSQPHKVVEVEKVTTQLVSGTLTEIHFKIMPVQSTGDVISCLSKVWEQSWLNKKDIDVKCQIGDGKWRSKRHAFGGQTERNPNDPKYLELANESMQKYLQTTGNSQPHKVVEVEKVTTQLVSGTLTEIHFKIMPVQSTGDVISCLSKVWEQSWLNKKDIDVKCQIGDGKWRSKRQVIAGGITEKNPNDPKYLELANESMQKYLQTTGNSRPHKVVEVERVTTQVVAGFMTRIYFKILPMQGTGDVISCLSKVWERSRQEKDIDVKCQIGDGKWRSKRQAFGGQTERNPNDPKYLELANESMQKYLQTTGNSQPHKVVEVEKVTTQLVSGTLTEIHFKIMPVQSTGDVISCLSKVWEQSWLNRKDIDVKCQIGDGKWRSKRQVIAGGITEKNPNDPKYLELANESMQKYLQTTGNSRPHKVVEVERVTTQVVAGFMTRIYFKILPMQGTGDVISCLSKVWERSRQEKDIDVNCQVGDGKWRLKRQVIAGGITEKNPNGSQYLDLAGKNQLNHNKKKHSGLGTKKSDRIIVEKLVRESLEKLEKSSAHKHKQRVYQIINYSSKKPSEPTSIYFDVGYTTCLKFEIVNDITQCKFLNDTPLRHCVSQVWERPWLKDGKDIEVNCEERSIEEMNSENAMLLAASALKHIEAKYSHPRRQKVVKLISFGKQLIAGVHYRMTIEVGPTNCLALSSKQKCTLVDNMGPNKICHVNVWPRPSVDRLLNIRVVCDHKTGSNFTLRNQEARVLFNDFLDTYKPAYASNETEKLRRFEIFRNNVKMIHALNIGDAGTARYGVTKFADLTHEEFKTQFLGLKPSLRNQNQIPMTKAVIPEVNLPGAFDWRQRGAVTPVKDQGSCGSCWAFSVTGNVEGQWQLKTGNLLSLSEQELVDCDKLDDGCNGGYMDNAYRAIEQMGGLELEDDYPYAGKAHDRCSYNKTLSRVTISGAVNISNNETDMAKWLVKNGPISIGINANAMQFYMGGVSHPWRMLCSPDNLDHGVLIVGYGVSDYPLFHKRLPYWIVKNSWGPSWGERGYYRVYRGDGTCGVNMMASSAVV
ncbi:uncharacterized protein LOC106716117 isoform X5 [Papilio machaon]|uniref:uncharacterized protein LOC106716117 isoform X5 n=1 Tax=Papilio machaon TaxID=76193 RepID=UPI001E663FED|nr:uncharacterized protein LOC106716117 isoform X5 [Papilio machaon]